MYIACKPVSSKWRDLGARLGVLENTLATIEADHNGVERCMSAMISVWLRRPQGEVTDRVIPSRRDLCVAISHIDGGHAEAIAKKYDCNYISQAGEISVDLVVLLLIFLFFFSSYCNHFSQ